MTLNLEPHSQSSSCEPELPTQGAPDLESILFDSNLPLHVRNAKIAQVFERLMDDAEIARVTELQTDDPALRERVRIRRNALAGHLGSMLICILIHLPGVAYTIEIDPISEQIVHWEWQRL